jgi:hypothetical protein
VRLTGLAAGFHAVVHLPADTAEQDVIQAARSRSALTPNWPRPALTGARAAPWRSPSAGMRADTTARPGMAGLTCCPGGKGHPENGRRVPAAGAAVHGRANEAFFLVTAPKTVPGSGFSRPCQQPRRGSRA